MNEMELPWDDWEIVKEIGRGSYGVVYEINNAKTRKKEAVKVMSFPRDDSQIRKLYLEKHSKEDIKSVCKASVDKVHEEYNLMRSLKGQRNVVKCNAFKTVEHTDGIGSDVFIRMELLTPLVEYLLRNEMDEAEIVKFGIDICTALVECQSKGIIHRDIKPENLFVSPRGIFKLGDFGIARVMDHTTYATMTGTYPYIAPEVFKSNKYGKEADIYSFGLVMYWLLNNCRGPFLPIDRPYTYEECDRANKRRMGGEKIPAPIHGSNQLKKIVLKACEYDSNDRYQTAIKLLEDLETLSAKNNPVKTGSGRVRKAAPQKTPVSKNLSKEEKTVQVPRPKNTGSRFEEGTNGVSHQDNNHDEVGSLKNEYDEQNNRIRDNDNTSLSKQIKKSFFRFIKGIGFIVFCTGIILWIIGFGEFNKLLVLGIGALIWVVGDWNLPVQSVHRFDDNKTTQIAEGKYDKSNYDQIAVKELDRILKNTVLLDHETVKIECKGFQYDNELHEYQIKLILENKYTEEISIQSSIVSVDGCQMPGRICSGDLCVDLMRGEKTADLVIINRKDLELYRLNSITTIGIQFSFATDDGDFVDSDMLYFDVPNRVRKKYCFDSNRGKKIYEGYNICIYDMGCNLRSLEESGVWLFIENSSNGELSLSLHRDEVIYNGKTYKKIWLEFIEKGNCMMSLIKPDQYSILKIKHAKFSLDGYIYHEANSFITEEIELFYE